MVAGKDIYGERARIGVMLPAVNMVAEPQIQGMLPSGVSMHVTRLPFRGPGEANVQEMVNALEMGADLLAAASVDLIVFHCTAVTMHRPGMDDELTARITAASGLPATATSTAVINAFDKLGARRIALTSPYFAATNAREVAFLADKGIEVVSETGMDLTGGKALYGVEPATWVDRVKAQADPSVEAYFISCTAVRSAEVIDELEAALKRPVVTSNQAMTFEAVSRCGIADSVDGYGVLLRDPALRDVSSGAP